MALSNITVFEMSGLAPAPFAGLILSDFGANVIRIDRSNGLQSDVLTRNKRSLAMDLKSHDAIQALLTLFKSADVILDPFRPGVMEKLGLGPEVVMAINPRVIYARLSGYGQSTSSISQAAGHDINYLAISGALSLFGRQQENPSFPLNVLADFAGGGLMCVMGILMALVERSKSGKGQIVDAGLTAGTAYLVTHAYLLQKHGFILDSDRGTNLLDGGAHFYEVYQTKDHQYMAVGAIEPQFYACLLEKLELDASALPDQFDRSSWPKMKDMFQRIFSSKTQYEWTRLFDTADACVTPVLSFKHPIPQADQDADIQWPIQAPPPQPAPSLSRTPAKPYRPTDNMPLLKPGAHSIEILEEFGMNHSQIQRLLRSNSVFDYSVKKAKI
ncbi:CoA-transferase family III domain-containing protein [Blakeslea trispora]|nr:CoA-transferase family III domain-containing protein [Blakeslea trispora]